MIEMLQSSGHYPAFIACLIGGGIGIAMIAFGLIVKFTNR